MTRILEKINIHQPVQKWHEQIFFHAHPNDSIFFSNNVDDSIWFSSNYLQYLNSKGASETICIYGEQIHNLTDFIYQANYSLPVGYRLGTNPHGLYDLLLNFETEPVYRILFWNDAQSLFNEKKHVFEEIFELLIVAAYCNRNAISTIKEKQSRYRVDQRNFMIFNNISIDDLSYLLYKDYYIPSIGNDGLDKKIDFNLFELTQHHPPL
jgi:hypothetical protein